MYRNTGLTSAKREHSQVHVTAYLKQPPTTSCFYRVASPSTASLNCALERTSTYHDECDARRQCISVQAAHYMGRGERGRRNRSVESGHSGRWAWSQ